MALVALTFPPLSIFNSQRLRITPDSLSLVGWAVQAWSPLWDLLTEKVVTAVLFFLKFA